MSTHRYRNTCGYYVPKQVRHRFYRLSPEDRVMSVVWDSRVVSFVNEIRSIVFLRI
jgi:hypothetical protein